MRSFAVAALVLLPTAKRSRTTCSSVQSKRAEYYPEWVERPDSERPALRSEDGR